MADEDEHHPLEHLMDFPPVDPASARARLADWKERTDKMAADTQALTAQVQALRATAADPDELAEATVDHTGSLVDLVFSTRVRRVPEEHSARAVLQAVQAAKAKLAERSQEIVQATVGDDSPTGQAFLSGLKRQFGNDPEQDGDR
ncbi:MAG TPA: YbaB/EbfC family nucleoid-associated protein [Glycomyces sp.]|jgi:hypothetical protein|nr:YbaB/EbfC family nucleoid-associated protein [Glycomyces sp.]